MDVHGVRVQEVSELNSGEYDAVVVVLAEGGPVPQALEDLVAAARALDRALDRRVSLQACTRVAGGRLVLAPTGPLTPYDDVRSVGEAARAGVRRALDAGARRPVLVLQPHPRWPHAELVALLGALEALYVPLQVREAGEERRAEALGVCGEGARAPVARLLREAAALEVARGVVRDVGGADQERMTPAATARYLRALWPAAAKGPVTVRVVDDPATLLREYPLFAAVNRAAATVERHRGCVIFLEYTPSSYEQTVMLVGKGVTFDTGGADLKVGGAMAGMSRDKCGAATVAGFVRACELLQAGVRVVAALGMVRNSVGEEAYLPDELVRSRSGLAVRVGNTDAEGRMVLADLLAELAERAPAERRPHLYTVATLTGHACRAYGPYTAALDNHVARAGRHAEALRAGGEALGDALEVSTLRREDLAAHRGRGEGDDLLQAAPLPSTQLARGHQGPAAFLLLAARLERAALPYTHLDVAGSGGTLPEPVTGAGLLALAAHYRLVELDGEKAPL